MMKRASHGALLLAALAAHSLAYAAGVTLSTAWMRPAPAQAEAARVYVDIASDTTLELVGASTPVAREVVIVRVGTIGDESTEQVVKSFPVPAGRTTRLAYRGDHLRLVGIKRDLANGDPVPLTLAFKDAAGKRVEASTSVTVRGILLPQQMPAASVDAPHPAPAPAQPATADAPKM